MSKLKAALDLFNIEYKTLVGCVHVYLEILVL